MKSASHPTLLLTVLAGSVALLLSPSTEAAVIYRVTVNTAPLVDVSTGSPFALDFTLNAGLAVANTATINGFSFGLGGAATNNPPATATGNASGSLGSSIILNSTTNGSIFNDLYQGFTPGSAFAFNLTLTTNAPTIGSSQADGFAFSILDSSLFPIDTNSPGGDDSLLVIDITGNNPVVHTYTASNGVTITAVAVPEAGTALFGLAMLGACGVVRSRRTHLVARA